METIVAPRANSSVLFVGEGNFSFSSCLIDCHWKDSICDMNVFSTCYEMDFVSDFAKKNVAKLKKFGVKVVSGVDATNLRRTVDLEDQLFDLVLFMFPHIGGKMKIQKNRDLIKEFAVNIRPFLNFGGSVIVTLAGGQGGTPVDPIQRREADHWQIVKTMAYGGLELVTAELFQATAETLPDYMSHGYRGWNQGFHTEKGVIHVFKVPEDSIQWFSTVAQTKSSNSDKYISEKLERLTNANCFIGHVWRRVLKQLDISSPSVQVIHQMLDDPGCYLLVKKANLKDLGTSCPIVPIICVDKTSERKLGRDISYTDLSKCNLVDVLSLAENELRQKLAISEREYFWQQLWKLGLTAMECDTTHLGSLYPPEYQHCISFWLPDDGPGEINQEDLAWGLLLSGNDCVVSCEIMDIYKKEGRVANTLRLRYTSHLFPLSPIGVIQFQEKSIGAFLLSIGCVQK